MKLLISGSLACSEEIIKLKYKLEEEGIKALLPISLEEGVEPSIETRKCLLQDLLHDVSKCDGLLVANFNKGGVENYIGYSTFAEMSVAFFQQKPIYLLNPIPNMELKEEVEAMSPIILHGSVKNLRAKIS